MPRENSLTALAARLASLPFSLFGRRPFTPPQKALILQPCCLSQVMLTTPLLGVLRQTFPQAQFDWAVSDWARPAIMGHPGISTLVSTSPGSLRDASFAELGALAQRLRAGNYDTCFIPSRSSYMSWVAWRAGIPQRVGLHINGRGFAHTLPVPAPPGEVHAATFYLALAAAVGIDTAKISRPPLEFYPGDAARSSITRRLIDECDWVGDRLLVVIHPGGGEGSGMSDQRKQWPVERFVLLCNQLQRRYKVQLLLVGSRQDLPRAQAIRGMLVTNLVDWTGKLSLAELGALAEVADLYIGNDTGPTHVAAAVGCQTIAIFGPSNPSLSAPYGSERDKVQVLWEPPPDGEPFDWQHGVQVNDVLRAAANFLR